MSLMTFIGYSLLVLSGYWVLVKFDSHRHGYRAGLEDGRPAGKMVITFESLVSDGDYFVARVKQSELLKWGVTVRVSGTLDLSHPLDSQR